MSVFLTNDELQTFAKNGFDGVAIKNTVAHYRSQGLDDDAIRARIDKQLTNFAANEYGGPENVEKARAAVQQVKNNAPSNTLKDNLLTKEALASGVRSLGVGAERVANAATLGAYDWANTKLGGTSRERAAEFIKDADEQGLGIPARAGYLMSEIGGSAISPATRALGALGNVATKGITQPLVRDVVGGTLTGGAFGGIRSGFDSDFDPATTAKGAALGAAIGGTIPVVKEGVKMVGRGVKNAITGLKKGVEKTRFVGGMLGRSQEEIARGAQDISGALPDNGEMAGSAVKNLSDDVMRGVKDKTAALYDKAEQLASGSKVVLDKNSNLGKVVKTMASNATKTQKQELQRVWDEVEHTTQNAPSYETAKSYRSWLSEKAATGGTGLTKKQYGDLVAALDKDIESSIGNEAMAAKKAADAFYRNEMSNPDSITNSVDKLLRKDPVSVVGNRAIASAQGKAWKASPLEKVLQRGEQIGSPYIEDVKQALQANTTTRAQFNRMAPAQKQMIYGDKLPLAEKNFNGGALNWAERQLLGATDLITKPTVRVLEALSPISGEIGSLGVAVTRGLKATEISEILKALANKKGA